MWCEAFSVIARTKVFDFPGFDALDVVSAWDNSNIIFKSIFVFYIYFWNRLIDNSILFISTPCRRVYQVYWCDPIDDIVFRFQFYDLRFDFVFVTGAHMARIRIPCSRCLEDFNGEDQDRVINFLCSGDGTTNFILFPFEMEICSMILADSHRR